MPSALPDLFAWMQYDEAPLKNCAVAAMELPKNPHMECKAILFLILHHLGDVEFTACLKLLPARP